MNKNSLNGFSALPCCYSLLLKGHIDRALATQKHTHTHTKSKTKQSQNLISFVVRATSRSIVTMGDGTLYWDLAAYHWSARDLSCKLPAPRKLTLFSNEGHTVTCFTIFKLYWFYIVKLKATLENKAQNKKIWERKKRAQNKHNTFQGDTVAPTSVHIWLCVNSCVCQSGVRATPPKKNWTKHNRNKIVPTRLVASNTESKIYGTTVRARCNKATRQRRESKSFLIIALVNKHCKA